MHRHHPLPPGVITAIIHHPYIAKNGVDLQLTALIQALFL